MKSHFLIHKLFIYISLTLHIFPSSHSCVFNYVPDADINDLVQFPWEQKTSWVRKILPDCECGTAINANGNSTSEEPWIALIRVRWPGGTESNPKETFCSGSLINSYFILTAYSCFIQEKFAAFETWGPKSRQVQPENVTVWLPPTNKAFDPESSASAVELNVSEIILDKSYASFIIRTRMTRNNVALLKLETELELESAHPFVPVCLNPVIDVKSAAAGKAYGWYSNSGKSSTTLKSLASEGLLIMDLKDCRIDSISKIAEGHICLPPLTAKKKIDGFGAPLALNSFSQQYLLQVGILSWSDELIQRKNNKGYHHLFYTTVKSAMPFINYYSEMHAAAWCEEPPVDEFVVKVHTSKRSKALDLSGPWNWIGSNSSNRTETKGCTCGIHTPAVGRIVGGFDAIPHEFKWQVLLRIRVFGNARKTKVQYTVCGGSVVNDRMILLAAHCVVQQALLENEDEEKSPVVEPRNIEAFVNAHLRKDDPDAKLLKVKRVYVHPGYLLAQISKESFFDWDVALLELERPLKFDQKIIPICLPKTGDELALVGKHATITGWGLTDTTRTDSLAHSLQKIEVPIQDLSVCRKVALNKITDRFLCAGTLDRNKDASQGDSGGPLIMIGSKPNQYVQIGIVSWGEDVEGSHNETAALYSDVQSALSYIDYYSKEVGALWCPS